MEGAAMIAGYENDSSCLVFKRRAILKLAVGFAGSTALGSVPAWSSDDTIPTPKITNVKLEVRSVDDRPTYNGLTPGPTIRVDPGETIDIDFTNSLQPLHDDCTENPNNFHGFNTTNLHMHGLHVSPNTDSSGKFDADNVFLSIVPEGQLVSCSDVCGESVKSTFRWNKTKYRFELGENHTSGTYWYHAHKHGSTAQQVGAGLSGPVIVPDRPGSMPEYIEQAEERILMLMNQGLTLADPNGGGEIDPVINIRPGEVQRWRIINALGNTTQFSFLRIDQPGLEVYQIAYDGFTLEKRVPFSLEHIDEPWLNPCALASGNRMDLIVRAPLDPSSKPFGQSIKNAIADLTNNATLARIFDVNVEVTGDPVDHLWSDNGGLPGCGLKPFGDTRLAQREISFSGRNQIDGGVFDGGTKQTMKLGAEEEWHVTNSAAVLHVFHIHVNPFFVTHINGEELDETDPRRRWQDTIGLPPRGDYGIGSVSYKTRFETFKGRFVIHCHVLRHEDIGMMQVVEIV